MSEYRTNIWKIYLYQFFSSLHFIGGILIPFFLDWGQISFTQIMLLQSWFFMWMFILEIPTGTIADFFGRKTSIALGLLVNVVAVLTYISMPNFYIFLFAEFLWAMSSALISGADEAFIYDTLKKFGKIKEAKKIFARSESIHMLGIMIAAPIGSIVAVNYGLRMPNMLMAIPLFIAFLIAMTFEEPVTNKKTEAKRYLNILKDGVKFFYEHKILKILALDMVLIGAVAYFMIWLYQPMLKAAGVPIEYYGFVHALFVLSQIAIMSNYTRIEKFLGKKKRLIFFSAFITGVMFIIGGLTTYLPIVLLVIVIGGGFGLSRGPLFSNYMNKYIPSAKRATILSSISMLRKFAIAIVNPFVGMLVDWSLSYTLIMLGVIAIAFAFISKVEEKHLID